MADGALDVEVDIDPAVVLAPDAEIEIFRIVQEGLANARKHVGARSAAVSIAQTGCRRFVSFRDSDLGLEDEDDDPGAGQGLKNMRTHAASIEGGFSLRSPLSFSLNTTVYCNMKANALTSRCQSI